MLLLFVSQLQSLNLFGHGVEVFSIIVLRASTVLSPALVITEIPFDFSQKFQTVPRPNRRAAV